MKTTKPKRLQAGDTIAIVSPASPIAPLGLEKGLAFLREQTPFHYRVMPHAFERQGYLAGSDRVRALDLIEAFRDPTIDAVLCSRGGYGCHRLLGLLDFDQMVQSQKPFIGYSDITALHLAIQRRGGISFHGPMAGHFQDPGDPEVLSQWLATLRGRAQSVQFPAATSVVEGKVGGVLRGGCLRLLLDAEGTSEPLISEDTILVMEDVGEKPHRIDAMLTQMLNAGIADSVNGFLIGEMTETNDLQPELGVTWQEIVVDRLAALGKPILSNVSIGHIKNPLTLALGARVELDTQSATLTYLESTCAE